MQLLTGRPFILTRNTLYPKRIGKCPFRYSTTASGPFSTCRPSGMACVLISGTILLAICCILALSSGVHMEAQNFSHEVSRRSLGDSLPESNDRMLEHYVRASSVLSLSLCLQLHRYLCSSCQLQGSRKDFSNPQIGVVSRWSFAYFHNLPDGISCIHLLVPRLLDQPISLPVQVMY